MSKYKIGITEAGDAGIDLSWVNKLDAVDGAVLVTKCISPDFFDAALEHKNKLILHATVTGYGGTVLEPNAPPPGAECNAIHGLIRNGFPQERVVIRIDPIIPTPKGLETAYDMFRGLMAVGFNRFRVSIIDMYPHVRERFRKANLPLPYGDGFSPSDEQVRATDICLGRAKEYWSYVRCGFNVFGDILRIEACAEPGLTEAIHCGCISEYDLRLLGLDPDAVDSVGYQRKNCMCYSGKTELLSNKKQCGHGCLYCYWRTAGAGN